MSDETGVTTRSAMIHPHLVHSHDRHAVRFVRGEGCWLIDDHGDRYLDLVAGIAVCALGHAHPAIAEAVSSQASTLVHCSNFYYHEPCGQLADELAQRSGFERVFFCNSGAEANEAAIKLARKRAYRLGQHERVTILACRNSFHGRTLGALAATDNPSYREGFGPLPEGFDFVEFNSVAALEAKIGARTAALIIEPVQGESGVVPATREFLEAARRLCSDRGAVLIFDEVQVGIGRLGALFAFQYFDVRPDVVTLAKALANGLPIGADLVDASIADVLQPGDHSTTFGGSPVPCAAALAHLRLRDKLGLDAHVERMGRRLLEGLAAIARDFPTLFHDPRGIGLMLGLPVREPYSAASFVRFALKHRLLLNAAGRNTLRFLPPLVIQRGEIDEGLTRLRAAIEVGMEASTWTGA